MAQQRDGTADFPRYAEAFHRKPGCGSVVGRSGNGVTGQSIADLRQVGGGLQAVFLGYCT